MDQKILWDCHMHSSFSADSDTPMEKMIQTAADKGLMGICFTEHFDPDYPDTPENLDFSLNIPAYRQKLESLTDAFKNQIQVNFGIELGLQPQLAESFSDLLKEVPFDFVIGSSHVVHGYDPYYPSYFEGRKESACYMEYFESILENIAAFDEMDVYGHIDYVVRYGPNQNRQYSYGRYKEILDEILFMQKDSGEKVSNIVLMGTGEPLDNYDNVLKFLHLVSCPEGINIGQRHISLSTSGIADRIEMLAREKLQITLSVSLHAPDDETRSSIMPVNDAYPVERLMRACRYYFDTTGRRISYEYMMARDKTDRPWQADLLAKLLKGRPAHVNLIPLNEVAESPLKPSRPETVRRFQQALEKRGVTATVRRKLGPDIDAACGQLRQRQLKEDGKSSSRD